MSRRVVGLDGTRDGWVAVVLDDGAVAEVARVDDPADAPVRWGDVPVGIDIPVGLLDVARRQADVAARSRLPHARSSVFAAPCRSVVDAWLAGDLPDHASANALSRRTTGAGLSVQSWNLVPKVAQADLAVAAGVGLLEVHPELAFHLLTGRALAGKRSWNGVLARLDALRSVGVVVPSHVEGGDRLPPDDVLDAAIVAWTAAGAHLPDGLRSHPEAPTQTDRGRPVAIWSRH